MNTSRLAIIFLLGLLLASACGCGRSQLHGALDRADSLLEHSGPDTAARVLLELKPLTADAPDDVAMRWRLLMVKAADKAYITHTSDSMLRPALDYYNHRTSDTLRPEAFYYAGRVYSDMGDYPRALDYYRLALSAMAADHNLRRQATIHDQMRWLYSQQYLYPQAMAHAQAFLDIARQSNDTSGLIQGYKIVATQYMSRADYNYVDYDSAHYYYSNAEKLAHDSRRWVEIDNIRLHLIDLFCYTGELHKADSVFSLGAGIYKNTKRSQRVAILSDYFRKTHRLDSCRVYAAYGLASDDSNDIMYGHMLMSYYCMNRKQYDRAMFHVEKYHRMLDSLRRIKNQSQTLRVEAAYDYSLRERDNIELQAAADSLRRTVLALIALLAALFGAGLSIYYRQRSRAYRMQLEKLCQDKHVCELEHEKRKLGMENTELRQEVKKLAEIRTNRELSEHEAISRIKSLLENPRSGKMTPDDWTALEEALDITLPGFCNRLRALGLDGRDYRISLLARFGLGNTDISALIGGSAQSIGMVRIRLSRKHANGNRSSDWDDYLKSL